LWIVLAAQLMLAMDFLIVVVALPGIQVDLGFSAVGLTWVPNAFGLAFGGLLLLGGRLGDMVGQVRAFRIGLCVFVVASLVGGLAQLPAVLIAARIAQGAGAALAAPSVLALVMIMARDEEETARGLSLFTAVSSIGASAGLILGGVLTDYLSWRWALLINVPVGALVMVAIGYLVAETHPKPTRLDVAGGLTRRSALSPWSMASSAPQKRAGLLRAHSRHSWVQPFFCSPSSGSRSPIPHRCST
jgi:MFS family permease